MKFSIVMASYLGEYAGASRQREEKIVRAVNSCLAQTFEDWELIIVADGCQKTLDIISDTFDDPRIVTYKIHRGALFSGGPRNKGIEEARGEYVTYLDTDDIFGKKHLATIAEYLNGYDWVWYNDIRFNPRLRIWYENECDIHVVSKHGTSNITHRKDLSARWEFRGYAHDHYFVNNLLKSPNFKKIESPEYYVCHVPGTRSSGGYDL